MSQAPHPNHGHGRKRSIWLHKNLKQILNARQIAEWDIPVQRDKPRVISARKLRGVLSDWVRHQVSPYSKRLDQLYVFSEEFRMYCLQEIIGEGHASRVKAFDDTRNKPKLYRDLQDLWYVKNRTTIPEDEEVQASAAITTCLTSLLTLEEVGHIYGVGDLEMLCHGRNDHIDYLDGRFRRHYCLLKHGLVPMHADMKTALIRWYTLSKKWNRAHVNWIISPLLSAI